MQCRAAVYLFGSMAGMAGPSMAPCVSSFQTSLCFIWYTARVFHVSSTLHLFTLTPRSLLRVLSLKFHLSETRRTNHKDFFQHQSTSLAKQPKNVGANGKFATCMSALTQKKTMDPFQMVPFLSLSGCNDKTLSLSFKKCEGRYLGRSRPY